jgi:hypothetical protein
MVHRRSPFDRNGHKPSIDRPKRQGPHAHRAEQSRKAHAELKLGLVLTVIAVIVALFLLHVL